jgi:hypothetical protein
MKNTIQILFSNTKHSFIFLHLNLIHSKVMITNMMLTESQNQTDDKIDIKIFKTNYSYCFQV